MTNKMKVPKALILFHRHGHRAPAKNIVSSTVSAGEDAFEKCPDEHKLWFRNCNLNSVTAPLATRHPVKHLETVDKLPFNPHDARTYPYGNLTGLGIDFLQQQANQLCSQFPVLNTFPLHNSDGSCNTVIHSTNYRRTQVGH